MCKGCWFGSSACVGAEKAYALAPVHGKANGTRTPGVAISKEDARISVAYCAEQMKNETDCSKQFIGVSMKDGQCWCAKKNYNCENFVEFTIHHGHFFKLIEGSEETSEGGGSNEGTIEVGLGRRLSTRRQYSMYVYLRACMQLSVHLLNSLLVYP